MSPKEVAGKEAPAAKGLVLNHRILAFIEGNKPHIGRRRIIVTEFIARQGDVLIRRVASIPSEAKPKERDGGRVILAYGEVTGHAHQIADPDAVGAVLLTVAESATFLRLTKKAQLVHEEHAPIDLAPGTYEVLHQREYAYGESIRVAD